MVLAELLRVQELAVTKTQAAAAVSQHQGGAADFQAEAINETACCACCETTGCQDEHQRRILNQPRLRNRIFTQGFQAHNDLQSTGTHRMDDAASRARCW